MTITLTELVTSDTGNSDVLAYSLEIDDGEAGDFEQYGDKSMLVEIVVPVLRGRIYRLRYRAYNSVGWGDYSDVLSALTAQPPERPLAPTYVSSTGSSITLAFEESQDDGGARISGYELWMSSDHEAANPTFSQVTGYTDNAMGYTLTSATDGLLAGEIYSFKLGAVNVKGQGELSDEFLVAAAELVAKPATPTRNLPLTTKASIYVDWSESSATDIVVQGYMLYMSDNKTGDFELVYNGSRNSLQRHFEATNLEMGNLYQFKVSAINFNGESELSDELTAHACVAPDPPALLQRVTGDATSITLSWTAPPDDGGCPLTGYQLFRDSGLGIGDSISTEVDASDVNNRPALTEHKVDLTSSETGLPVRF